MFGLDSSGGSLWDDILGLGTQLGQQWISAKLNEKAGGGGFVQTAAMPGVMTTMGSLPAIGGGMVTAAGMAVRAAGVLRSAAGRIIAVVLPSGVKVSRQAAMKLTKAVGYTAAASALGIGVNDLAEWMLSGAGKRRGKGVTGAQLRTTKRTMAVVEKMHRQIAGYCRDAGVRGKTRVVFAGKGKVCR